MQQTSANEQWLTAAFKNIGDLVIAADSEGKCKFMNSTAEALTGWSSQDALGQDIAQILHIVHESTHLPIENPIPQVLREGAITHLTDDALLIAQNGAAIPIDGNAAPVRDGGGDPIGVVLVLRDITDRKRTRQTLQETFEKVEHAKREWESTVDSLPDLVCLADDQGCVIRSNRIVETWELGRVTEVKGRKLHSLLHPGCADPACSLDSFLKQTTAKVQTQPAQHEGYDRSLNRYVLVSVRPISDQTCSAPHTSVVIVQDITERKQVEQERENLIGELDAFAQTVAHDLKDPVGLVIGFAEFEQGNPTSSSDELYESLRIIARVGHKMNNIIDELLLLAGVRQSKVEPQPLRMASIVSEAQQRLADMIQECKAKIILPTAWPIAAGHPPWVEEVWVNYLSNALKYGGRPPHVELGGTRQEDGMVRFWMRDNGPGLTPEEQAQIFTPFTRLGQIRATGHGLGLSIVRRIVEKLGGQVGVESDGVPGCGCTFYFTLPAA